MNTVLYVLVEVIRHIAILVQPVMPGSAAAILNQIAVPSSARQFSDLAQPIAPGLQLPSPRPVFPRYVDPEMPETGAPK
jgi:methionyl-tRNA synthetase